MELMLKQKLLQLDYTPHTDLRSKMHDSALQIALHFISICYWDFLWQSATQKKEYDTFFNIKKRNKYLVRVDRNGGETQDEAKYFRHVFITEEDHPVFAAKVELMNCIAAVLNTNTCDTFQIFNCKSNYGRMYFSSFSLVSNAFHWVGPRAQNVEK